ncbi:MAG: DUF1593 domain-containing protein, partial [Bacteroidales bacterium]|nr:DUF1593 domain-containing protein [Bacteroidales bacterium]
MKLQRILLVFCLLAYTYTIFGLQTPPDRPRIWVVSDYSPSTDKDDQVVMNVLLLWANEFRIEGLAPGSHKRNIATAGLNLFKKQHIAGYKKDYPNLSKCYSNFPTPAELEAVTYKSSTSDGKGYRVINNLNDFPSVKAMIEAARRGSAADPLYVLLWGPQGEGATAADWLLRNEPATLKKMVFVAHASRPANKYNCQQDATACKKLHDWASQGKLEFVECGDSGQKGIHKHTGGNKLSASVQKVSFWVNHKWNGGYPDWSDRASFVCLLPQFGVNFKSLKSNGADNTGYLTNVYKNNRNAMYKLIEERANKAINGGCNVAQFTIAASAGQGGKITPNGNVKVNKGDDKTFTITANAGYEIADVTVNGTSIGAQASYTFTNVSSDQSISATFKVSNVVTYTITATAGANGSITPSGAVAVQEGKNQKFTISAAAGYKVKDVLVDNASVGAVSSYTFSNVTADHSISATFEKTTTPTGPIVVTDVTSNCNKAKKAVNQISFTVSKKHNKVKVNQGKVIKDGGGKYRIQHVGAKFGSVVNYKITVLKKKKVVAKKTVKVTTISSCDPTQKEYTITATAGANGTITPSGAVKVKEGANRTFSIKAAAGYKVDDVLVDNASVGAVGTYTFTNVTKNHSIKATFVKSGGPVTDCAGVPGGTAYIDDCGECVGGTTGKEPCTPGGFDFIDYSAYTIGASHDGNQHDKDDILAAPMVIALIGQTGLVNKFVHMDYSNHLGNNNSGQAQKMAASVNGACEKWGVPKNVTFDCQKNLNGAVNSIKNAINEATASKRF